MAFAAQQITRRHVPERGRPDARSQTEIGHILVCLDRSPFAETSLPHAVAMARVFGARITLLHVMQPPHAATQVPAGQVAVAFGVLQTLPHDPQCAGSNRSVSQPLVASASQLA